MEHICIFCELPIEGSMIGAGDGTGQKFAHPDCFWRDKAENLETTLQRIKDWCRAYPVDLFPEPDFKKARQALEENGISLDDISASNMRHVLSGIQTLINET